ncbi:hypothetical protein AciX8_4318 [Granulicella mallensis MP5ACTX8]|uniref:Lipoprotein n=1 Tax=Granulicella mallensis (strain ATCC BAA-1857 / DSM 23137 / MP5ACTX8) TaxID=682795 RepID=G8NT79_GRAMM|nr:hypothetical protein AciX8_4318 [Granulicella mallensis MP5ACTX8]
MRLGQAFIVLLSVGLLAGCWQAVQVHNYQSLLIAVPVNVVLQFRLIAFIRKQKQIMARRFAR